MYTNTIDTLEHFAIGELAEELDQNSVALTEAIRARQLDSGCKPARGGSRAPTLGEAARREPAGAAEARERGSEEGVAEPASANNCAQGDAANNLQTNAAGARERDGCEERGGPAGGREPKDGSASMTVCAGTLKGAKGASNGGQGGGAKSVHGGAVGGREPCGSTSGTERVGTGGKRAAELRDAGNGGHCEKVRQSGRTLP